jgi:hypothetical protein
VLNVTADTGSFNDGGGLWSNQGTINRTTSTGTATLGVPVTSGGNINVNTGTLDISGGLTQTGGMTDVKSGATLGGAIALQAGTLKGAGTASGSVTNTGGTVQPGASPGKLTIGGNYTQGAGGTLQVEIDGTGQGTTHDWLAVGGNASLNGTLAIVNNPSFDPALTDTFDVLTAVGTVSGTFSPVTGAVLTGKTYTPQYTTGPPGKVRLALTQVQAAPTNSTAPSIPSSATQGDSISCDPGSWSGSPSFGFEWLRDGAAIAGATSQSYTVTADDVGKAITCRVTATNAGGSAQATSNAVTPAAPPPPPPADPPPADPPPPAAPAPQQQTPAAVPPAPQEPAAPTETIRGEQAFEQGTANDLYLACTRLDLLLIDVLPAAGRRVSVTGSADLRLVGRTVEIALDGRRVGTAVIAPDGSFAARVPAPSRARRATARYQARIGATRSQRLRLVRRMVATSLTREGDVLVLRGQITRPFARTPAPIRIQRFLSCQRRETVAVARVVPNRRGLFTVRIPVPADAPAAIYRALTKVAPRPGARATASTFTLPRAIDLR